MKHLYDNQVYMTLFPSFLPLELAKMIISYTELLQPQILLADIENYIETKREITSIYLNRFHNNIFEANKWFYLTSIGFFSSINKNINNLVIKWKRLFILRDKKNKYIKKIANHFINSKTISYGKKINLLWGVYTCEERNHLVSVIKFFSPSYI